MFEDDDFEIDEEFLDGVFDAEKSAIKSDVSLDLTLNNPSESLDSTFESPTPVKKRKPFPFGSPSSSSLNKPDSALQTSEKTARLIALVSQRHPPSQRAHSDKEQLDTCTSNHESLSQNNYNFRNANQVNAPGHQFRKPPPPQSHSPNSPTLRNFPQNSCISEASFALNKSRVRQRKFPGPAGLLPERGRSHVQGQRPNFSTLLDTSGSDLDEPEEPLCSQSSASVLQDGPWTALQCDLAGEGQALLKRYSVAWVRQKAAARQLVGQKVPFLAAILHSIDCSSPDPCVVLKDSTGEIPGTLHRSVWDSFGGQLIAGSALVLRLVGVLSTGISARRHYLNITSNNILTIYSSPLSESSDPDTSNNIRKTDVQKWTSKQLLQAADSWEDQSKQKQDASIHPSPVLRNPNLSPSNNTIRNFRPPLQLSNSCNNSASTNFSAIRPTYQRPAKSNYPPSGASHFSANSVLRPQVPPGNKVATSSQNLDPLKEVNSAPKTVGINQSTIQSRFVPKRPSFPVGQGSQPLPCSSASSSQANSQTSADLFSDADDVDISSVLDGIDSESLFGDF